MGKRLPPAVELEAEALTPALRQKVKAGYRGSASHPVERIPQDRVSLRGQMHADLVLPAGAERDEGKREAALPNEPPDRGLRILAGRRDAHASCIVAVAPERRCNHMRPFRQRSPHAGQIELLHCMSCDERVQASLKLRGKREEDASCRILIEPLHGLGRGAPAFFLKMLPDACCERIRLAACPIRMHEDARRLVGTEQECILEKDIGSTRCCIRRIGTFCCVLPEDKHDQISCIQSICWPERPGISREAPLLKDLLPLRLRDAGSFEERICCHVCIHGE